MFYLSLIAAIAAVDQTLKSTFEKQEPKEFPRPLPHTKDKIWLYRNHNAGFPFGFLETHGELVRLLPLTVTSALGGILAFLYPKRGETARKLGLSLLIAGSTSNLYDRFVRRYVIDYFSIRIGALKKVVLNLGDLSVFFGAAVLLLLEVAQDLRAASGD